MLVRSFEFVEPSTLSAVFQVLQAGQGQARLIAGGSDLLGELKEDVVHYEQLVSLADLADLRTIRVDDTGLRLGAMVTLTQLEHEARLQGGYRIVAEAARGVATPEIRARGTLGGNLCQRPRCLYYRSALSPCLKKGGADCPALASPYQDYLALMGGHGCFCVHASDLAPALMVLEGSVVLAHTQGERSLPLVQFFRGPEHDVQRENVLGEAEVVVAITLPEPPEGWRGTYLKARERTAGDFPIVSVAVGYAVDHGLIRDPRLVLGGVAPVPWPSPTAAAVLNGQAPSPELAARAAAVALEAASPLAHNAFKIDIGRALIARAIMAVASRS